MNDHEKEELLKALADEKKALNSVWLFAGLVVLDALAIKYSNISFWEAVLLLMLGALSACCMVAALVKD
jgi:hypothetical protein